MSGEQRRLPIDVWADIACPWCYVGERRLAAALTRRPDVVPVFRWMPFQLQPGLPPEGLPWREFAEAKFGGWDRARTMFAQVAAAGSPDGIAFRFEEIGRAPNTAAAHRLMLFAQERGRVREVAESLFAAYFEEARDIGDLATLADLAARAGLDPGEAREWLDSGASAFEVEQAQNLAGRMGITGVPFYIFDGRLALSGAQPVETFVAAIDRATEKEPAA